MSYDVSLNFQEFNTTVLGLFKNHAHKLYIIMFTVKILVVLTFNSPPHPDFMFLFAFISLEVTT